MQHKRIYEMKSIATVMTAALVGAVCAGGVESTVDDNILRVASRVHSNPSVFVSKEETKAKALGHCVDTGAVNHDPVCASNGMQYLNEDVFEYHKCIIQAEYTEIIEIVDMDTGKNAKKEDNEPRGVPDIDYM